MRESYSINIHVMHGNPNGVRLVTRPADWNGSAIVFPKEDFESAKETGILDSAGVYILWSSDAQGSPIYVGQSEQLAYRISDHIKQKPFWNKATVFVSDKNILNAGHIKWLEHKLIQRLNELGTRTIKNANLPSETQLSIQDTDLSKAFLKRMFEIMPLTGLTAFEDNSDDVEIITEEEIKAPSVVTDVDTIIVPTGKTGQGFEEVFLSQNCWYWVRISEPKRKTLKYIAAYRPSPMSAISHVAEIESIEPYGPEGRYKINFKDKAKLIDPIPFGTAKSGAMQGPRFCNWDQLQICKDLGSIL